MLAFWLGCLAAFLTAFYSWRLLIMAFHGTPVNAEVMAHVHESPRGDDSSFVGSGNWCGVLWLAWV